MDRTLQWGILGLFLTLYLFIYDNATMVILLWILSTGIILLLEWRLRVAKRELEVTLTIPGEEKITFLTRPFEKGGFTHFRPLGDSHVRFMGFASHERTIPIKAEGDYQNPQQVPATLTFRGQTLKIKVNRMVTRCHCEEDTPHWVGHFYYGDFEGHQEGEFLSGAYSFVIASFPKAKEKIRRAIPDCSLQELPQIEMLVTVHIKAP